MDNQQLPSSIEEVEALISQLYGSGPPQTVANNQKILHRLQLSPQGWKLANTLLRRKGEQVRFFAALTFIIKLNTDANSLSGNDVESLLLTLINSLIEWIESGEGPLVGRKLCSALVAYFLQFSSSWSECVKHLLYCLCVNKALPYGSLKESPDTSVLVQNISAKKAQITFWFAAMLVEDVGKTDSNSMKANDFHRRVKPNVNDIVPLIGEYISHGPDPKFISIQKEAMRCFQSWVSYSHRSFIDKEAELEPLHLLTQAALQFMVNYDLYEITVELFTDILSSYSRFLRPEDFSSLHALVSTPWAQQKYQTLVEGDYEWDSLQFGFFLLALGDATVKELTQNIEDPQCNQYLSLLSGLLNAKGYAIAEDKIYVPALEFWSTFVESMVDETFAQDNGSIPVWFPSAQRHVMRVIESCWRKSQFPPAQIFNSWDSVDSTAFKDARRDFSDLIQQFYLTTGLPLLQFWVDQIPRSATSKNWPELEASLFCLAQLNDSVAEEPKRDEILDRVFTPHLLSLFANPQLEIFTRVRRAFLNLIIGYADYFGKRPSLLPNVLNFSFGALGSSSLAIPASRSIMKLCSDCRNKLLPDLDGFLQHYSTIASNNTLDGVVKESVMEGIACLIQAIDDERSKLGPLSQLLDYVEADVAQCLLKEQHPVSEASNNSSISIMNEAMALDIGVVALKCLLGIARGIQSPDDKPIELEKDDDASLRVWYEIEGSHVQQRIYGIICRLYESLGHRGEVVEECCHIWRQGIRELEPGPFVLPPYLIVQFMMKANNQTPRLGLMIKTAACLTSSKWVSEPKEVLGPLLAWVAHLLQSLGEPGVDTEISHAGIEFIHRLLPRYVSVLFSHQPPASLEFFFIFALQALQGTEPLPKAAAAEFWGTFISLTSQPSEIQSSLDSAIQQLGPLLAQALIFNIGGGAARSELEKLADPVKKLTTSQINARRWFEQALLDPGFPSDKINDKDKAVFLQKIMNLRGAKATTQVVRDFWLACRGSNFAYAS